jgi:hypothetical protein
MGCPTEVEIGNNLVFSIATHDPDTGVLTDADAVPSYRIYEAETAVAILIGTMSKLDDANTTGFYTELIACTAANGFESGKSYTVYIEATVDGDTGGISYGFVATPANYSGVTFTAEGLDICNDALILIGDDTVLSIDPPDDNDRARACKRLYPRIRDEVLRAYPWNCAKTRATLTRLAATPTWGYTYQFQLPTLPYCLRVLSTDMDEYGFAYKIEGRVLLTDEDAVNILYIARVTDPAQFDSLLMGAMTARLAAELCTTLTGDAVKSKEMWNLYFAKLTEAQQVDGMEQGSYDIIQSQDLVNVRL